MIGFRERGEYRRNIGTRGWIFESFHPPMIPETRYPYRHEKDRVMVTIQAFSGIPGVVAGLPVSAIIPAITLGFLAAIIVLRLNRDMYNPMGDENAE